MNFAVQTFISLARNSFKEKYEGQILFSAKPEKVTKISQKKIPHMGDTNSLDVCGLNSIVSKN